MTTTYEEIHKNLPLRDRHAVFFQKKPEYSFYLYEGEKWIQCKNVDSLPYHLTIYQTEDGTEIATCEDSYRIVTVEQYENGDIPTKEDLEYEKEWRSKMNEKDELDFNDYKEGWIKAQIAWKKADIIPNVWNINKRKGNWIGYYYYESKKFAESSTHTEKYTKEFLENEKQKEEDTRIWVEERNKRYEKISNSIRSIRQKIIDENELNYFSVFEKYNIKNLLDYYLTLDIQDRLTDDYIKEMIETGEFANNNNILDTEFYKNLVSMLYKKCNGCISNLEISLKEGHNKNCYFWSDKYDSYYDICIDYDEGIKEDVIIELSGHAVCKGVYNKETNFIEFPDFHRLNPLITLDKFLVSSKSFTPDMKIKCYYKGILYDTEPRMFILGKNTFYPNYVKSEDLYFFESMGMGGFKTKAKYIELVNLPQPSSII